MTTNSAMIVSRQVYALLIATRPAMTAYSPEAGHKYGGGRVFLGGASQK
jgi:hypothetical protein